MEEKIFLIYVCDSEDNCVIGLVVGTYEDAEKFCDLRNAENADPCIDFWYAETEILNYKEIGK